jgi:hypothetical protein
MYTKLDDWRDAHKVNKVLQDEPNATRKRISKQTYLCDARLVQLHKLELINIEHTYRRFVNDAKATTPICE